MPEPAGSARVSQPAPRAIALAVVRDVFDAKSGGAARSAQASLDYRLRAARASPRDRAQAAQLAYGAIKMRRTLDWYLHPYVGARQKPLPAAIAEILRLGAYEILFTGSPEHAATSEFVNLAKHYGHRGTAGLVNAVLRSLLRDRPAAPQARDFEDADEYWGVKHSFPTWLVRQFHTVFGERAEEILVACNAPARSSVSVNRARTSREAVSRWFEGRGASARASEIAQDALLVDDAALVHCAQGEANGAWWVQSETSAMVVDTVDPQPGDEVLDLCSGRGNKALQSAARLNGRGALTCVERDPRKAAVLQNRLAQAGFAAAVVIGDATAILADRRFDCIVLDAPCSGVGVVGRHPEARWRKRHDDGERLAPLQRALLQAALARLRPGGRLVYAVCSTDPRETTEIAGGRASSERLVPPGIDGRDGFFLARMERA